MTGAQPSRLLLGCPGSNAASGTLALQSQRFPGSQYFDGAGNQRIGTGFNVHLTVEELDVCWDAFAFVADHVSRKVLLIRQSVAPAIRKFLFQLIRKYTVR